MFSEAVMMVLSADDSKDQEKKTKSHANDDNVGLRSEILKCLQCLECDLWSIGALTAKNVNFYVEEFLKYSNDSTTKQDKKKWKASERSNVAATVQDKNLNFSKSKKDTIGKKNALKKLLTDLLLTLIPISGKVPHQMLSPFSQFLEIFHEAKNL